jgi:pyruvate-formate lyase-activating enzyme
MFPKPTRRAVVDVGHRCNIKCLHCYHAHEKDPKFKNLPELKYEISQAKDRGNNYIDFTGGEPTIHPNMAELVEYCGSLNLKCCIITNGLAGEGATESLLKAGVDDFLVSVHGTKETCDKVMQSPGSRHRQERFLYQIKNSGFDEHGFSYRFNCCMLKMNQNDLVATAKWAAEWKPRIFNFINFNPHHAWNKDVEGTKNVIADLNVLEGQLSEAIPILLDAGIGVNVRYYPMCRLPEIFRQHVCNDLQVLFDPYEWDYCNMPKTFQAYYTSGVNMSNGNEWKGQPCQQCSVRYMCGGPNSAFYRASGMRGCLSPVKDSSLPRDDFYYYRRNNTVCLTPRVPEENTMCIAAIADDRCRAFVPLFLYCALKAYPEYDIKVFTNYSGHDEIKQVVDRYVGYGVYESCVVKSENVASEYGDAPAITAAMRFVEFEEHLKDYDNVLWTDVDILFHADGDLIKKHRDQMVEDGTECYESAQPFEGYEIPRLCAVLFITKEWWGKTATAREWAKTELKNAVNPEKTFDEQLLLKIVQRSELPESPKGDRKWRKHGNHAGDWFLWKSLHEEPSSLSDQCMYSIKVLLKDKNFMDMVAVIKTIDEKSMSFVEMWSSRFDKKVVPPLEATPAIKIDQSVVITSVEPKKTETKRHDGSLLIFTVCDEAYQWYIPMFFRSLQLSLPEIDAKVILLGKEDPEMIELLSRLTIKSSIQCIDQKLPGPYSVAAYRFLVKPPTEKEYDYCLITDIDMMMFKENTSIVDQHMRHLVIDETACYENWISQVRDEEVRIPGIHFVTNEWWNTTVDARGKELGLLIKNGANESGYDEWMLGRIIKNSGLPLPSKKVKMWSHGVHIGSWKSKIKIDPNVWQRDHIKVLLEDAVFMSVAAGSAKRIDTVEKALKKWPNLFI